MISTKPLAQEQILNTQHNGGLRNILATSLENNVHSGWSLDVDNNHLRALVEANLSTSVWELASKLDVMYIIIFNHLRDWKDKNLISRCLVNWTTTKRNPVMNCHLPFFYATSTTHFSVVTCDDEWVLYNWQRSAQWLVIRHQRSSTTLLEAKFAPKRSCWLFFDLRPISSIIVFLNESETITAEEVWMKCIRNFGNNTQH